MKMSVLWTAAALLSRLTATAVAQAPAGDKGVATGDVPKEVRALEGTYTGSWAMYGIDDEGTVVRRMAWTDTLKTDGARVAGDRAFVSWSNEMKFEGAAGTSAKVQGKEGYMLTKGATLRDYFVETFGRATRMTRLADNVWGYAAQGSAQELAMLGFPRGASGQHVQVKVVTKERGLETHRISRLSTVTWTDKEGKERVLQFVTLQGHHQRRP
jgi:hypothetical protein